MVQARCGPSIKTLLEERTRILEKLDNKTKNLDFIQTNRLIFAFQRNIVRHQQMKRYIRWFDLAAKTKRPDNKAEDFEAFEHDDDFNPIYQRIKKRLIQENLKAEEKQYITDEASKQTKIQRTIDGYVDELSSEMEMLQEKIEKSKKILEEKDQALERALQALMSQGFSEEDTRKILTGKQA